MRFSEVAIRKRMELGDICNISEFLYTLGIEAIGNKNLAKLVILGHVRQGIRT